MEAAAKRARAGGGSICDRLSALPDELLRHVLSFLPAQQVVKTTVLSKRWVDLWRSVPGMNLDLNDFYREGSNRWSLEVWKEAWERLEDFATNLLVLRNAPCLDVFRLKANYVSYNSRRRLDAWIRRAIKDNPFVLQLLVGCYRDRCRHYYQLPHLGSSPCRRLKRLGLNGLFLDHSFAELLHSWFPQLEDLILRQCRQRFNVIQSDKLKNLDVIECQYESEDVFVIRAPRLASLRLDINHSDYKKFISLDAGDSLVKASVDIPDGDWPPRSEVMLLASLFSVTSLELIGFQPEAMLDEEFDKFPIFNNLKTLLLGTHFEEINEEHKLYKAHGKFLQKSPNLEKLTLKNWPAVPIELPTLENLRTLILHGCNLQNDFKLLRHCLQCSPNLEKLGLELCTFPEDWEGGEGMTESKMSRNLATFKCPKLKSTEILHDNDDNIAGLVSFLLGISGRGPKNVITLVSQ